MKKIYFILAALCLCIPSCKDNSDALVVSDLTGLWRVYNSPNPLWYRFSGDFVVEQFLYVEEEKRYDYCQGTYSVSGDRLTINLKKEQIYVMEVVLRCVAEFTDPNRNGRLRHF